MHGLRPANAQKEHQKYAEELDLQLWLNFSNPVAVADGKEVEAKKVKQAIYKARKAGDTIKGI